VYELFKVFEPSGIATNTYKVYDYTNAPWLFWGQGHSGAGMYIRVYVAPTDVSFYKAHCMEVGEDATGVWGYYTNNPPWTTNILSHKGSTGAGKGDDPFGINPDNSWQNNGTGTYDWDRCTMGNPDPISPNPQWSSGGYTWNIPGAWTVDGNTWHTNMGSWSQTFTMQGDGTVTIQKFNQTVTRNPSSP